MQKTDSNTVFSKNKQKISYRILSKGHCALRSFLRSYIPTNEKAWYRHAYAAIATLRVLTFLGFAPLRWSHPACGTRTLLYRRNPVVPTFKRLMTNTFCLYYDPQSRILSVPRAKKIPLNKNVPFRPQVENCLTFLKGIFVIIITPSLVR